MRVLFSLIIILFSAQTFSQELFVSTEPASNIPARSVSVRLSGQFVPFDRIYARPGQRYIPELMVGLHKNLMISGGVSFSNMQTFDFKRESFFMYGKYRFISRDELHKHFRMAAFTQGSKTKAPFHFEEATLMGDKTGLELGVIATQLWNKLALSGSVSHIQLLDASRYNEVVYIPERYYRFMNYSISTGYLLFPKEYSDYKQVNVNLYIEALGQQALNHERYFVDIAPAAQLVFFSNTKLSASYRFQLSGNMDRMTRKSWLISLERSFLNVFK